MRIRLACLSAILFMSSCDDTPTRPAPRPDPGIWILDSNVVLDEFPFRADACAEVFPSGSYSSDSIPPGSVAHVRVVSTACWKLTARVVDSDSDTVRILAPRFGLFHRTEDEKNRGVVGFAAWDGKDAAGKDLGPGRYLWRMEFDFGLGRIRRFRADILIP